VAGDPRFFAGTDSAPHVEANKLTDCEPPGVARSCSAMHSPIRLRLAEICLCHACSCHEIEDGHARTGGCAGCFTAAQAVEMYHPPPRHRCLPRLEIPLT
jgi:dihydroorotase